MDRFKPGFYYGEGEKMCNKSVVCWKYVGSRGLVYKNILAVRSNLWCVGVCAILMEGVYMRSIGCELLMQEHSRLL